LTKNRPLGLKHDGFNEQYQVLMEKNNNTETFEHAYCTNTHSKVWV